MDLSTNFNGCVHVDPSSFHFIDIFFSSVKSSKQITQVM